MNAKEIEIPFGAFDSETMGWTYTIPEGFTAKIEDGKIIVEKKESDDENLKNKSGYHKAGKFWKASTLWNAIKDKIPQRVPNRYILQECTWNIGTLQQFADEVKNVQEVSLDYPIILDINGNILDGAHRVVKAYLEGKDIDIVYLGDDEWPEPDYDEEKSVKKCSITAQDSVYLEKQKEQKPVININHLKSYMLQYLQDATNRKDDGEIEADTDYWAKKLLGLMEVEQKLAEWSEEDELMRSACIAFIQDEKFKGYERAYECVDWLNSLRPQPHWKPSEEQMKIFNEAIEHYSKHWDSEDIKILCSLYDDLKKL